MRKTMLWAATALIALGAAGAAQAQSADAPAGWIDDLAAGGGPTPTTYTLYTTNFIASGPNTTLNFAFRETPAYFAFDNVSVTNTTTSTPVTLQNQSFESSAAAVTTNFPGDGWGRWIQSVDTAAIGVVATNTQTYGCNVGAEDGSVFWCDGSVQGYDGLYQTIATTAGDSYQISFWLEDDSGSNWIDTGNGTDPTGDQIDTLVYAENGVNVTPLGTTSIGTPPPTGVPEPITLSLFGAGIAGAVAMRRRKKASV